LKKLSDVWKMNPSQIQTIRQALQLNTGILAQIPDDFLSLAFIRRGARLDRRYAQQLQRTYGFTNNESLEFFGDSILHMIITEFLFELKTLREGVATRLRIMLENNDALRCLMVERNLCQYIRSQNAQVNPKACADALEAIIGVVYVYLDVFLHRPDAYALTADWFTRTFKLPDLYQMVSHGERISCPMPSDTYVPQTRSQRSPTRPPPPPIVSQQSQQSQQSTLPRRPEMDESPLFEDDIPGHTQILIPRNLPENFEPILSVPPNDTRIAWADYPVD
jgi:dsRNA-specific ribonuclease